MRHLDEARSIWADYVPAQGQAETVQGELLRAVEKLRDEAVRNGNVNWDEGHEALGNYVGERLASGGEVFGSEDLVEIRRNVALALDAAHPAGDDVYDQLADRVVEWCRAHPEPMAHTFDPQLRR